MTILMSLLGHIKILFLILHVFVSHEIGKCCLALSFQSIQPWIVSTIEMLWYLEIFTLVRLIMCTSWPDFSVFLPQCHILLDIWPWDNYSTLINLSFSYYVCTDLPAYQSPNHHEHVIRSEKISPCVAPSIVCRTY